MRTTDGRIVASVEDDILHKRVSAKKHMLKKPPSWAFDATLIDDAVKAGATRIEVFDSDSRLTYGVSVRLFRAEAFRVNRQHNKQLALHIKYWATTDGGWLQAEQRYARQLGLPLQHHPDTLA